MDFVSITSGHFVRPHHCKLVLMARGDCALRRVPGNVWRKLWLSQPVGKGTGGGERPGMLPNILQCTGQPFATNNYTNQNISSTEVEVPWSR